ncbi:hypothetical protein [Denitromonas iodatirespirans]|uniref:IPTL-CTERM sorting domain-containing protein n=1 Tax=Denitromonas iodatirespirans TaxID=2795389 RepID=A0A944DB42_DENI1|nr:hypothetical protein [Denitromonas iodatirespirans]MBT0961776.1 hypothetical protein [Denitromonas iodatirespirans]
MFQRILTTASLLALTSLPALAHPGHTDQSIHWSEWLATALLLSTAGGIVLVRRVARRRPARR